MKKQKSTHGAQLKMSTSGGSGLAMLHSERQQEAAQSTLKWAMTPTNSPSI
jgi:hypothetical protein